jgi:Leucine-rich repeat (LRR) protein
MAEFSEQARPRRHAEVVFPAPVEFSIPCDLDDEEIEPEIPPADRIITPGDVITLSAEDDSAVIIGTRGLKVTRIAGLEHMHNLSNLVLRSCLIASMNGVDNCTRLEKLEIYDNQLIKISSLENLKLLKILVRSLHCYYVSMYMTTI